MHRFRQWPSFQFSKRKSASLEYLYCSIMWFMDNHKSTRNVRFGGDYRRDKEYYLRILHSCPCSNTTATDPCNPTKQAYICVDIDDKLKSVPQGEKQVAFDLGTIDLSAPWKYAHCTEYDDGVNAPCSP